MTVLPVVGACIAVLLAFAVARRLSRAARHATLANPILVAALIIWAGLGAAGIAPERFVAHTRPLRLALDVAIVAMGALLVQHRARLAANWRALALAIGGGSLAGILSAVALARLLELPRELAMALSAKSVTSPFAITLMDRLGGPAALAAGLVIATGIIGAALAPPLLDLIGVRSSAARGTATGMSAHIVGTESLLRRDPEAAAFSAATMVLAGLTTALMLPLLWPLLF